MELRLLSSSTVLAVQIIIFIKLHVLVTSGHSVSGDQAQLASGSSQLVPSKDIAKEILALDPVQNVFSSVDELQGEPLQGQLSLDPAQLARWSSKLRSWAEKPSHGLKDTISESDNAPLDKRWREFNSFGKRSDGERDRDVFGVEGVDNYPGEWSKAAKDDWKGIEIPEKKWKEMSVWGKRDEIPEKKWKEMSVWGKRDEIPEKKWKEMSVWGKRDEIPEKKWKEMSVWGKRDEIPEKKWKEMSVWGKRDEIPEKKWKEMSVWGKRDETPDKKWKEMSVWGKRSGVAEKKWKEMSVWGKRDDNLVNKNWGKRSTALELSRIWKSMPVWDKRSFQLKPGHTFRRIQNMPNLENAWRKRPSWRTPGLTTWGKRASPAGLSAQEQRFQRQFHKVQDLLFGQEGQVQEHPQEDSAADKGPTAAQKRMEG
ncbi:hypothetical protein EGW08_020084 [Elysia chlorotica]|uniref:Uncharacterized protein n=1 Tax=Elysia chlorotica TaxID=188477 RepID=A0A3S1AZD0_ELYCH|nr:hypothetical protein EGW08_020084 [Elysia chlorotica]